jgi:hypothetical protein
MRTAPAERHRAEHLLEGQGWTVVKINKGGRDMDLGQASRMLKWCEDHIGPGRMEPNFEKGQWLDGLDVWYSFTWYGHWTFHFKHDADATAFALRWA